MDANFFHTTLLGPRMFQNLKGSPTFTLVDYELYECKAWKPREDPNINFSICIYYYVLHAAWSFTFLSSGTSASHCAQIQRRHFFLAAPIPTGRTRLVASNGAKGHLRWVRGSVGWWDVVYTLLWLMEIPRGHGNMATLPFNSWLSIPNHPRDFSPAATNMTMTHDHQHCYHHDHKHRISRQQGMERSYRILSKQKAWKWRTSRNCLSILD